jgi:2-methylcitrate dehydratase PrpD
MNETDRRDALRNAGLAVTAAAIGDPPVSMQAQALVPKVVIKQAELPNDLTRKLARFIISAHLADMPEAVRHEAKRTLLNWVGCALGGSQHQTVANAVAALSAFFGARQATLFGRPERPDVLHAALLNGISSHVLDFDDTHAQTTIHPAAPVVPAILALAEYQQVSGRDFIEALVIGIEAECRIGKAVVPAHYDSGWHITGTAGVFGSAAAAGKLLGLNEQQMCWALGLAAAQPVGLIEMFGSMAKSFHPGRAAQNGLAAAHLAAKGFTASEHALEAHFGWLNVLSTERNSAALDGEGWEILKNSYKPFACGLVVHPVIDGCIQLRNSSRPTAGRIERVEVVVHPRVMQITAIKEPKTGLEGKFSVYHAAAVAIVEGAAGERQFSDEAVRAPATAALRRRVFPTPDPAIGKDQARITVVLENGERLTIFVEHAVGSIENPMSDRMIEDKFHSLADRVLNQHQARSIVDLCWRVDELADPGEIARTGGKS